jgi:hypothetical protein
VEAKYPDPDLKETFTDPQHWFLPGGCRVSLGLVQRHVEARHMGLVLSCQICAQSFSRRDKYKTHLKNKHGVLQ